MKILVADDSYTFLNLISASLAKLGHTVIQANNGDEAIAIFKDSQPDLIILDVVMGETGGFECARKIRMINSEDWIPIIFLSSSVNDESIAKGIEAGGDDYLTKPYSDVTLEAKIKAMQRIAEMRQQLLFKSDELRRISSTDALTGLYNRFEFEKAIRKKMSSAVRHHYKIALLFIALDHFKSINDTFGHGIGDLLLKDVADRLMKQTRMDDFIARIGGDEFVVILNKIESDQIAGVVAKKIIDAINKDYFINDKHLKVTSSIGVACLPQKNCNSAAIIQNADIAMYAAKDLGRNNFQFYTEELNKKYRHQLGLENELKFAIDKEELYLVYQPIYNLLTKKIIGAETLLRWTHPEYGKISPNVFIPIAEESGLIIDIGHWVMMQACNQGQRWVKEGNKNFTLSINVSIQQLIHEQFMDRMLEVLNETKISPHNIELELTEGTVITYTNQLKETMLKLHSLGIRLSIDDFGTRYSTLTSLRHLPISTLKIDKEFVINVETDKKNAIIVKSLIALGENLNLNVIAEGVESEDELQFLLVNGCKFGQGFLMMKPVKGDILGKILSQEKTDSVSK